MPPRPSDKARKSATESEQEKRRKEESKLEQALEDTFPASDPVAVTHPTFVRPKSNGG